AAPTTPIVFVNVTDPLGTGLVSSLAYPGGNITGFTNYELSMGGKWLEFLKEIAPSTNRVAAIHNPDNPIMSAQVRSVEMARSKLGSRWLGSPRATLRSSSEPSATLRQSQMAPSLFSSILSHWHIET